MGWQICCILALTMTCILFVPGIIGHGPCLVTKEVIYHGRISYDGTLLRQVSKTGLQMCIKMCEATGSCTHINYQNWDLKCDLMAGTVDNRSLDFDPSGQMAFAALKTDILVKC